MLESEARTWLGIMAAATSTPTLSTTEIDLLLSGAKRADSLAIAPDSYPAWLPSHTYAVGQTVAPTVRNGHFYTVTIAGAGDATEPIWPTGVGATVTSGGVTFAESGRALWAPTWDLNAAAAEGWRWKIGKLGADAASMGRERVGDIEQDGGKVVESMQAMVKLYQSRVIQNLQVPGGLTHTLGQVVGN